MENRFAGMTWLSSLEDFFLTLKPQAVMGLKVVFASALGAVLGYERERHHKPAGLRTNMLISGGAALLLLLGRVVMSSMGSKLPVEALSVDPTRLIHAIIVGVSFIGAGVILKSPETHAVQNLTTAATLLFSAGAGMCVAEELYLLAGFVTAAALVINTLVKKTE